MILAPGQPIPYGRPYRCHPNGPIHMMIVRKRVGLLPVQKLAVRHSVDHSSSDYFSLDDSARDSSLDSSSEASSDFHSDASSDSSSRHSLSDHSSPDLSSTSTGPSHLEVGPRETSLRDDVIAIVEDVDRDEIETGVRGPVEVRVERITHPAIPEDIPEPAQEGVVEVTYETLGDLV
nr:hypothetical protein [Tanacetum cinerariifolium]